MFSFPSKLKGPFGNSSAAGSTAYRQSDGGKLTSLAASIIQIRSARSSSNTDPYINAQEFPKGRLGFGPRPSLPALVYSNSYSSAESLIPHTPSSSAHFRRIRNATQGSPAATADHLPSRFNTIAQSNSSGIATNRSGELRSPSLASTSTANLDPMQEGLRSTSWNKYSLSNYSSAMTISTSSIMDTSDREAAPCDPRVHTNKSKTTLSLTPFPKNNNTHSRGNGEELPPPAYSTQVIFPTVENLNFPTPPPTDWKGFTVRQSLAARPRPMSVNHSVLIPPFTQFRTESMAPDSLIHPH
jgi:hypothetical protein